MSTASKRKARNSPADPRKKGFGIGAALAILTLAAYSGVLSNGFIGFDDNAYVTQNRLVQAGITREGITWALTTGHAANWHPLTWLSHMLDCQLFGLSPAGHHGMSLALHVTSTLLLFHLFLRMTAQLGASAFVAAVFAVHPLHVESVAWAAERKDVLGALFWILTTLAYVRWVEKPSLGRQALVLGCFALGLLSKPMLVTLPFTLLLLDRWPLRRMRSPGEAGRGFGGLVVEKIPLFALAAASSVVTFLVQRATDAMSLGEKVSLGVRAENALVAYARYLGKAFFPAGLVVHYPHPAEAYPIALVAGAALLLGAVTAWTCSQGSRRPWLAVGWLWFLGTLVPVIGLVQVGSQAMADRYVYVPLIGLSVSVAYAGAELFQTTRGARPAIGILFFLAIALWTAQTRKQVGYWKDDVALFGHAIEVLPDDYLPHGMIGDAYAREGRSDLAEKEYREAVRLWPSYAQGHNNLGTLLEQSGRTDEASSEYETALHWWPECPEAHHNLGRILAGKGRVDEAIAHYRATLQHDPGMAEAHVNLAVALQATGVVDEAIEHYELGLRLKPGMPAAAEVERRLQMLRGSKRTP